MSALRPIGNFRSVFSASERAKRRLESSASFLTVAFPLCLSVACSTHNTDNYNRQLRLPSGSSDLIIAARWCFHCADCRRRWGAKVVAIHSNDDQLVIDYFGERDNGQMIGCDVGKRKRESKRNMDHDCGCRAHECRHSHYWSMGRKWADTLSLLVHRLRVRMRMRLRRRTRMRVFLWLLRWRKAIKGDFRALLEKKY